MPKNLRVLRATKILERRLFLKALGFGIAAPFAAHLARNATAQPSGAPKRFFLMYVPHGTAPEHFNPTVGASPTDFTLAKSDNSILGPLEAYKQYVNVYGGFHYPGQAETHSGIVNCLSGFTGVDDSTSRTTVEHVIAKAIGAKPLILGACSHQTYGLDANGKLFWDGSTAVDPEKNPAKAADALFGNTAAPSPAPTGNADSELRNELLKLTSGEIESLSRELSGLTTEQTKLATHLAAVQQLSSGGPGSPGLMSCTTKPSLPKVEEVRKASAGLVVDSSGGNDYFYQEKNFTLLFEAQLELIAQALICNAAPVVGLMPMYATCDFNFEFMGSSGSHHNTLSHTSPGIKGQWDSPISVDNYDPVQRAPFAKCQRWFTQKLVDKVVSLLATTDDPADPSKKVLDNTLIYCMSEVGDGANHTRTSRIDHPQVPNYLPLFTIGKCGGAVNSGQVIQFPLGKDDADAAKVNRPAADLYLTLARAMGAANATFPGTTGVIEGVLA